MKKILILFFVLCSIFPTYAQDQTKTYPDLFRFNLNKLGEISENDLIKGYWALYQGDSKDKKNNSYSLVFLDVNLKEVASSKITLPNTSQVTNVVYNGKNIFMTLVSYKEKNMELRIYDTKAEMKNSLKIPKLSRMMVTQIAMSDANENGSGMTFIEPILNEGVILNIPTEGFGYNIILVDNEAKIKWESASNPKDGKFQSASNLTVMDDVITFYKTTRANLLVGKFKTTIEGINLKNGEKVFSTILKDDTYSKYPVFFQYDEKEKLSYISGEIKGADDNFKDKSKGIFISKINKAGEIVEEKMLTYENEISKVIPVNKKGKMDDGAYFFLHKGAKLSNGKFYLVAEQFKKAVSGEGIAASFLSDKKQGLSNFVILNMMVLEFDEKLNMVKAEVIEKDKSVVQLPAGYESMGSNVAAMLMKSYGYFDYQFTQVNKSNDGFKSIYIDYDKQKGANNDKFIVGGIGVDLNNKISVDKIDVNSKAYRFGVYPAKENHVLIAEIIKENKTKKLNLRLVKLNF